MLPPGLTGRTVPDVPVADLVRVRGSATPDGDIDFPMYGSILASMDETFKEMEKLREVEPDFLAKLKSLKN